MRNPVENWKFLRKNCRRFDKTGTDFCGEDPSSLKDLNFLDVQFEMKFTDFGMQGRWDR